MDKQTLRPEYRPDIDGLRAIAVLAVVIYHAFPDKLQGGFAGVDVFFVISGFLISTLLFQKIDHGSFSICDFYARRIRRIFPALALVLGCVLAFGWLCLLPKELQQLGKHVASSAGFMQNITLWKEVGYFDHAGETKPLLHIWSLGVEEQFYFFWPLVLWGATRLGVRYKKPFYFLVALFVFFVSFTLNLFSIKTDPWKTFYLPQYRFFEIALGGVLAWIVLYKPSIGAAFARSRVAEKRLKNILSFVGIVTLIACFATFSRETIFPGKNAAVPIFATAFIIYGGANSWLNRNVLSHKILVWVGLVSYPLYLWHWPMLSFLRIIEGQIPSYKFRWCAVAVSVLLSWLTAKFVEKSFRYGKANVRLKVAALCCSIFIVGVFGIYVNKMDLSFSHTFERLPIKRKGAEFALGYSFDWYRGKDDWLFLGNAFNRNVEKLKLAIIPSSAEIKALREQFANFARVGSEFNTNVVVIVGPNKYNIYPEYLPDAFMPSSKKYSSFFLEKLQDIPNLIVYDPTADLLRLKETEGYLYWKTDSHWNYKGSFLAFKGFAEIMGLPVPQVEFRHGRTHSGDLIYLGKLKNFPLYEEDNWDIVWTRTPELVTEDLDEQQSTLELNTFGKSHVVINPNPLSNKKIWIFGDSFTRSLKPYLDATFKEVRYVGHWSYKLEDLPTRLAQAKEKPDMIVIVMTERSF